MASPQGAAAPAAQSFSGSVSFKAYLIQNGADKPKEVRRFGMEENEVTSFDLLKKKLRQVFPCLARHEFTVSWKDFEEDDIIISSNEELLTALTETTGQVRRLYLMLKNPISISIQPSFECKPFADLIADIKIPVNAADAETNDSDDAEDEGVILTTPGCKRSWHSALRATGPKTHPNVYCDGCNKSISSQRYKCLECDDFDLCLDCESKMLHKDHVMLRIPLSKCHYTMFNHFSKSMHHMSDALHKIENRCKKQDRRMHKLMESNAERERCERLRRCADLLATDDKIHLSKRCKRDASEKEVKRNQPSTTIPCSSAVGGSASASASASASNAQEATSDRKRGCPFPSGLLSSFLSPQTIGSLLNPQNLSTLQQLLEHISPVPEQLLQEVAQNLADVRLNDSKTPVPPPTAPSMNPFAVNTPKAPASTETDGAIPSTSSGVRASVPHGTCPAPKVSCPAPEASCPAPEFCGPAPEASCPAPEASCPSPLIVLEDSVKQMISPAVAQALASVQSEGSQEVIRTSLVDSVQAQSGRSSRSSSEETDAEGWMVVGSRVQENNQDQGPVYPKLPVVEPTPEHMASKPTDQTPMPVHRDPHVQSCLRGLAEMGYDAADPAILSLAEEYKGNLNRVLNFLLA